MDKRKDIWITTVDNPYDPFTQWDMWLRYDSRMGYNTISRLARVMRPSNKLSKEEWDIRFLTAINDILSFYEPYEVYRLVVEGETRKFGK